MEMFETWPPSAVATVTATLLATAASMGVAVASGTWSWTSWRREHRLRLAMFQWQRVTWALEMASSDDVGRAEIGAATAAAMYGIPPMRDDEWGYVHNLLTLIMRED